MKKVFLQGNNTDFFKKGFCGNCLLPVKEWEKGRDFVQYEDGITVFGAYDRRGNLYGFLCRRCAERAEHERRKER